MIARIRVVLGEGVEVLSEIRILWLRDVLRILGSGRSRGRSGGIGFGDNAMNKWTGAHSVVPLFLGGREDLAQWLSGRVVS